MLHHADDSTFGAQVLQASGPVLVEFFTPSCGPCRQLEPHLQQLAQQFSGRLKVVKVNSEQSIQTARVYGIQMAPTLMLFLDGQIKSTIQGAPPPNKLASFVNAYLW